MNSSFLNFKKEADVNIRDENGNNIVHWAASKNKFELLQFLLKYFKTDIDARNNCNEKPLNVAVKNNALECVRILVSNNCDVNHPMMNGESPLVYVINLQNSGSFVQSRRAEMLNILIKFPNIDLKKKVCGATALHFAAANGNVSAVKAIIDEDPSLNTMLDDLGNCPIHVAVEYGHKSVFEALLEKECDVNITNAFDETPLHYATYYNCINVELWKSRFKIIKYLIDLNANCNASDTLENTVLHNVFINFRNCCFHDKFANFCVLHESVEECNIIHEIRANQPKNFHTKCVFLALAEYLIRNGNADIYKKNMKNLTPLEMDQFGASIVSYFEQLWNFVHSS